MLDIAKHIPRFQLRVAHLDDVAQFAEHLVDRGFVVFFEVLGRTRQVQRAFGGQVVPPIAVGVPVSQVAPVVHKVSKPESRSTPLMLSSPARPAAWTETASRESIKDDTMTWATGLLDSIDVRLHSFE
jgi:hypothetical protein